MRTPETGIALALLVLFIQAIWPDATLAGPPPAPPAARAEPIYRHADGLSPPPVQIEFVDRERIGVLERELTEDERVYFEALETRTTRAALQALRGAGLTCAPASDRYGSSGKRGRFQRDGLVVRGLGPTVECRQGTDLDLSIRANLHRRFSPPRSPKQTRRLAPDMWLIYDEFTMSKDAFGMAILAVGDLTDADPDHRARTRVTIYPGVLRPGAVSLHLDVSGKEQTKVLEILSKLDPAPLRELFQNPIALPPRPAPALEGSVASGPRGPVELAVYRAVLADHGGEHAVVRARTKDCEQRSGFVKMVSAMAPDLLRSALEDYVDVSSESEPLPTTLAPAVLLSQERYARFFPRAPKSGQDGWQAFRKRYPQARGFVTLSRVGLSRDRTQAVVYLGWQADWTMGLGEILFLAKTGDTWRVRYRMRMWIS